MSLVQSIISSPAIYKLASNTTSQVALKTSVQAVGQPAFVIANNQIDSQTKKFSATKEFLYQLLCLGINFAIIVPVFQKNAFKIARKFYKNEPVFRAFNTAAEFKKFASLERTREKQGYLRELGIQEEIKDINVKFGRGMMDLISIIGSVLGLAIMAPLLSKPIVRPLLRALGIDKDNNQEKK